MKDFIIAGMGRSGTRFLAENMNKSEKWTVIHEAGRWHDMKRPVEEIQKRFHEDYYGEVNGYLRFVIDKIKCEKKGIILRNPVDIWLSITSWHNQERWANRRKKKWNEDFRATIRAIPHLLELAESGKYYVISFERMTTELEYLRDIFEYFGIDDVDVNHEMLTTKINEAPEETRTSWKDFSPKIKDEILKLNDDYLRRIEKIFMGDKK